VRFPDQEVVSKGGNSFKFIPKGGRGGVTGRKFEDKPAASILAIDGWSIIAPVCFPGILIFDYKEYQCQGVALTKPSLWGVIECEEFDYSEAAFTPIKRGNSHSSQRNWMTSLRR
jgi:hypothetical protein